MSTDLAVHQIVLVVDVEGFGDPHRTTPNQLAVRRGLYTALRRAFSDAGVSWTACHHEDRGDGVFFLAPGAMHKARFVESLPTALVVALREHNHVHSAEEQIRLRMALHAGEVAYDEHGVTARSINLAFRLLDAQPLKEALAKSPGVLALIVSGWFFEEVVRHSPACGPATYRPVKVSVKETSTVAWICLPDHPYAVDESQVALSGETPGCVPVISEVSGAVHGAAVQAQTICGDVQLHGHGEQVTPRQLPAAVPRLFTARQQELRALTRALDDAGAGIAVVRGVGGVGKTWLALHWAHRNIDRFPDGQLFVNLRGFSPDGKPISPSAALRGFLDAFQVAPSAVPEDVDALAGLFRSLVADRRMLIVLDNAVDAAQVKPLLPGGSNCAVIVTSRRDLSGLVTAHGAASVVLDVLDQPSALQVLARHLGSRRLIAEPKAAKELLRCSAGLPLALGIVAARASTNPGFPLVLLADELHDATTRLDGLDTGDTDSSLRAVLSWSHAGLTDDAAHLFGLLGAVPGPDIALTSVFSLDPHPAARTRLLLRELEAAHLVLQHAPGRYKMHDLVRLYAREQSASLDLRPALTSLFEHYLNIAAHAVRVHYPHGRHSSPLAETSAPQSVPDVSDPDAATAWIEAERPNLVAVARFAAEHGCPILPIRLSVTMWAYLLNHSHHDDALALHRHALRASRRGGDRAGECRALINLGTVYERLRRYPEANDHLARGLVLSREIGDRPEEGRALSNLGIVCWLTGNYAGAVEHLETALRLSREFADANLESYALCKLGFVYRSLNRLADAVSHLQAALRMTRHIGDRVDEAFALCDLGACYVVLDRYDQAHTLLQQALALSRELGDRAAEALTLTFLGALHRRTGSLPDAVDALQLSIAVSRRLGDRCLEAKAFNELGEAYWTLGDQIRAIGCHCFAMVRAKSIGDAYQLARAHEYLARAHLRSGNLADANHHRREAAQAYRWVSLPDGAVMHAAL